jgi:dihydroorotate dehydrogenase
MAAMLDTLYRIARPMLFQLDAETAHRLTLAMLSTYPVAPRPADPPELAVRLWGIDFSNPVGLAAGMDKDAIAVGAWQALGFGFAELGTITPRPQAGNPRPRVFRIADQRALVNRLGFPSDGMEAVARRIERYRRLGVRIRVGINLGPNKDTAGEAVAADYASLIARCGAIADFIVINVSSPNTPGLRDWQRPERMREIVASVDAAVRKLERRPPILIKLAPDLETADLRRICDTALELKLDGIVACNSTLARDEVGVSTACEGGLSGEPLRERARAVIREIYRHLGGKIPIVGVGGIASAADAYEHIRAGASLVELYTALVYEGPGLPAAINAGLARLVRRDGLSSITQAVGAAA